MIMIESYSKESSKPTDRILRGKRISEASQNGFCGANHPFRCSFLHLSWEFGSPDSYFE